MTNTNQNSRNAAQEQISAKAVRVLVVKTGIKAGIIRKPTSNHNQTSASQIKLDARPMLGAGKAGGLQVKTGIKAGIVRKPIGNHNETLATGRNEAPKLEGKPDPAADVKVQTGLKAGGDVPENRHKDWVR